MISGAAAAGALLPEHAESASISASISADDYVSFFIKLPPDNKNCVTSEKRQRFKRGSYHRFFRYFPLINVISGSGRNTAFFHVSDLSVRIFPYQLHSDRLARTFTAFRVPGVPAEERLYIRFKTMLVEKQCYYTSFLYDCQYHFNKNRTA